MGKPSDGDLLGLPGIPKPKKDDPEDVAWALSTAEAMWNRAENADAIKWIRKAAEAASEALADDRALELAKAAAELTALIKADVPGHEAGPRTLQSRAPPSSPSPVSRPIAPPAPSVRPVSVPQPQSRQPPPPLPISARAPSAPSAPSPPSARPPTLTRGPTAAPPVAPTSRPKIPAPVRSPALPPALPKVTPSRAGERRQRRSMTNLNEEAKRAAEIIARGGLDPELTKPFAQMPQSTTPKRARRSRPDPEETGRVPPIPEPSATELKKRAPDTDPHGLSPLEQRRMSRAEEMDQWPTESVVDGKELRPSGYDSGKTRVNAPAFVETSRRVIEAPKNELRASQALRVIVWRGPDGVHVAPAGTKVSAITIEAILVAIDPNVDLATWLKG